MRRSAVSAGRPDGLIRKISWKAGKSEVICLHGGLRLCRPYIGRMAKNFRADFEISVLHLCLSLHFICLSFPESQNNRKSADKLSEAETEIRGDEF